VLYTSLYGALRVRLWKKGAKACLGRTATTRPSSRLDLLSPARGRACSRGNSRTRSKRLRRRAARPRRRRVTSSRGTGLLEPQDESAPPATHTASDQSCQSERMVTSVEPRPDLDLVRCKFADRPPSLPLLEPAACRRVSLLKGHCRPSRRFKTCGGSGLGGQPSPPRLRDPAHALAGISWSSPVHSDAFAGPRT
jgi:hypothetical protein